MCLTSCIDFQALKLFIDNPLGPQYASSCAAAYISWSSSVWNNDKATAINTVTRTYVETIMTSEIITANYSILCDGVTRFDHVPNITVVTLATPTYFTTTWSSLDYSYPPYTPGPQPSCIINADDCDNLSTA